MADVQTEHAGVPDWGVDLPITERPGVPKEMTPPHPVPGAHWTTPARQEPTVPVLKRADLPELTPVYGTSAPPRGLSGQIRRLAYAIPDHHARHWLLLRIADRTDAIEHNLGHFLARAAPVVALAATAGAIYAKARKPRRRFPWR